MSSVKIILDDCGDNFFPGQTLTGRVECYFEAEESLRAIRIKFRGRAKTEWHERRHRAHPKRCSSKGLRCYAEENYFDQEYDLVQGGDDFKLAAGSHSYPFLYILPQQLPQSFEGKYGNIRYYIKATVDRPWKIDYEDRVGLNVVSPLDLNDLSEIQEPVALSTDKRLSRCWCIDSGELTFNVSLPATGYVPGQAIKIGCNVQNKTNVNVKNELEFIAQPSSNRKYDEYIIAEQIFGGPTGPQSEKSWICALYVPEDRVFPNLTPCSIMNIGYCLKGEIVVPCPHSNLDVEIPIIIGTTPLSEVALPEIPLSIEETLLLSNAEAKTPSLAK